MPESARHLAGPIYEWSLPDIRPDIARLGAVRCVAPVRPGLALGAFSSGGRTSARLAAYQPGDWRWTVTATGESGVLTVPVPAAGSRWPASALGMSANRRHMVQADGTPVFFLADTDWFTTWKAGPAEWATLLDHRAAQGFSVAQVHLMPFDLKLTDFDGNAAFIAGDVSRPNEAYFARIDRFCQMAAERGIYVAIFLIWGGPRPTLQAVNFTTEQAAAMIHYAVSRYAAYPVPWSTSGDAPYVQELDKWEAIGDAVEEADPYGQPTTNHLSPDMNWYELFHTSKWHDFHMIQTGHHRENAPDVMNLAQHYYQLAPTKAYVNGEPWYDHHPDRDHGGYGRCFDARDERYAFWVSVLSGATMGHTYGSQGVWNWKRPGDSENDFGGPADRAGLDGGDPSSRAARTALSGRSGCARCRGGTSSRDRRRSTRAGAGELRAETRGGVHPG